MFIREMAHPAFDARRIRTVKIAASTGTREILQRIHDVMGIEGVVSKSGITEGYGNLTLCSPTDPLEKRLETVGRRYPGIDYRIVDPGSARLLPPREIGEIQVRSCAMEGYYHDAAATASMIDHDGWIHTGDLGWFDDAGYLSFAGRLKEMIKVGGENVSALELEEILLQHPDVRMAYVVSCPHAQMGEVPVSFVVPREGAELTGEQLDHYCRARLAGFKAPARHVLITADEMEFTGSGKCGKSCSKKKPRNCSGSCGEPAGDRRWSASGGPRASARDTTSRQREWNLYARH